VIIEVRPGSTAERAGLRLGDYILAVEQQPIDSAEDLARLIREKAIGDNVRIDVWRDGQNQQLTAQLQPVSQQSGDRNDDRGRMGQGNREADQQAAWIGVWLDQDEDSQQGGQKNDQGQQDQQGAIVRHVFPSGPAARAGLRDGDRVTAINGTKIERPEQLIDQVSSLKPGDSVEFTVNRNNNERKVNITVGRRGDFMGFGMQGQREGNDRGREGSERGMGDFNSGNVPGHAMMLEQNRRFAQQHERMEQLLVELRDEIRQLRADLGKDKQRSAQKENKPGSSNQPGSSSPPAAP